MTFSLVGRCADTAALGIAVSSSSPAVAARCAHVRAGVGAAGSQNVTDPRLGRRLLDLLAGGACARRAVDAVVAEAGALAAYRQLLVVDASGETAAYSGERTLGRHAQANVRDAVAAGNLLAGEEVPAAMAAEFASTVGRPLAERLLAALRAGLDAGGEAGPVRSAGLVVCDRVEWPVTDLRVDWHDDPVGELERLWAIWRPQAGDYVTRALDPASAPGYGVPGDDRP
jgi:uncharacterized Ntn-hydrolase superfamily protein